jgi:hypothetical protein
MSFQEEGYSRNASQHVIILIYALYYYYEREFHSFKEYLKCVNRLYDGKVVYEKASITFS